MSSVYSINKGVNHPICFRGLTAQWIWWLGGGLVGLLMLFTLLYLLEVPVVICLLVVLLLGIALFWLVYSMNRQYGVFGLMKKHASGKVPSKLRRKCNYSPQYMRR